MRAHAIIFLALVSACSSNDPPETNPDDVSGNALGIHPTDDDFGDDPGIGAGFGSEPPSSSTYGSSPSFGSEPAAPSAGVDDPQRLLVCLSLAPASISKKVAFCDSLPRSDMQARCMSHRWNRIEWTGWCYFEFTD
jgi:hypothetical protein